MARCLAAKRALLVLDDVIRAREAQKAEEVEKAKNTQEDSVSA